VLSFAEATSLLLHDGGDTTRSSSGKSIFSNARAVLTLAERNLSLWSQRHKERNRGKRTASIQQRTNFEQTECRIVATTNQSEG
jgi:hypothetical protein